MSSALLSNFMVVFVSTLVIESVRQYYLPFSKLLNTNNIQKTVAQHSQAEKSELERDVDSVKQEMRQMIQDAEKFNNPENYAKYGKIQR